MKHPEMLLPRFEPKPALMAVLFLSTEILEDALSGVCVFSSIPEPSCYWGSALVRLCCLLPSHCLLTSLICSSWAQMLEKCEWSGWPAGKPLECCYRVILTHCPFHQWPRSEMPTCVVTQGSALHLETSQMVGHLAPRLGMWVPFLILDEVLCPL